MAEEKMFLPGEVKELRVLGRTGKERNPLVLFWTGSGFEVNYTGSELWCEFETDYSCYEQWIAVVVNGATVTRQMLEKGRRRVCLLRNMQFGKVKNIKVLKEVQAMPGDSEAYLAVHALYGDGVFSELEEPECRIEFIGDSITSGEGSYGSTAEGDWISMWFSATHAYPYLVSERLKAEYRIVSQSGYGLCCAWDNNPDNAIPLFYEQTCGILSGERNERFGAKDLYDFSAWQPDYIVINLGTNDAGAFEQPEWCDEKSVRRKKMYKDENGRPAGECLEEIQHAASGFLRTVRKNNPKAQILWCYGMMGNTVETAIKGGIAEYKAQSGDKEVYYLAMEEIKGERIGARNHPGVLGYMAAAETIVSRICELKDGKED